MRSDAGRAWVGAMTFGLVACASPSTRDGATGARANSNDPEIAVEALPTVLEPFALSIPNTTVSIEMIPVPGSADNDWRSYWISRTEVPWEAFDVYVFGREIPRERRVAEFDVKSRPSKPYGSPDRGWGHQGFPALAMTPTAAEGFCAWLGELTGAALRLPTESEWEFAAAGGRARAADQSDNMAPPDRKAPADLGTAVGWAPSSGPRPVAVAASTANELGLLGMLGNVGEWAREDEPTANTPRYTLCGGHFLDAATDTVPWRRETQLEWWNATDPQNPKSRWWLSDAPFVGFRILASAPPDSTTSPTP